MREGVKTDLLIATLVVSAAVHVALMIWAEPKVMTHVVQGVTRAVRRAPMAVKRAEAPEEPVKFEIVQDMPAQKEAPEVEEVTVAAPTPDMLAPVPSAALPVPTAIEAPQILERLRPEADAPVIFVDKAVSSTSQQDDAMLAMPFDILAPITEFPVGGGVESAPAVAIELEAPVIEDLGLDVIDEPAVEPEPPEKMVAADDGDGDDESAFTPIEEVMGEVDELVVEREKEAVRDLIDASSAVEMSEAVNVDVSRYAGGDGYTYFKVHVTPKPDMKAIPKDVVILIDASGSIGEDRLASCRKAARAIMRSCMNTGDRFNLVAFRDRFSYAFRSWRECDKESFDAGDKWLSHLVAHGRTDVFATISSILTLPRDPKRPLIAMVVTDGDANAGVRTTSDILSKFSKLNDGLVSVFMYGVKASANRELIDVLTRGNRGESHIFEGWRWQAGSAIESLSERFRDPLVTDLRVVFPSSCQAEAYPSLLKNVYRGNDVTFVGRVAGQPADISFSLKGLAGETAYEGFFRMPLDGASVDPSIPAFWMQERDIDVKIH